MSTDGVALLHRWGEEVWNKPREGAIEEMFAAGGLAFGLGPQPMGPQEFKQYVQLMRGAFSDIHVKIDEGFQHGETVALRTTVEMVVRKTGKFIRVEGASFCRVRDGQIHEARNFYDFLDMAIKVGAVPPDTLQKIFAG